MTKRITMISPIQGGLTYGLLTVAGSPYTVDDALAAELVNRKVATFTDPQLPTGSDVAQIVYFTQAQFALIAAGLRGVTYEVTDAAGSPQYRWNGTAFVQTGSGGGTTAGVIGTYATAITATGSLTATHFGGTLVPVNSASAVQLNVPLDSALALSVLPALSFHAASFNVVGAGAVTFAGATGVTINGIAGPAAVTLSFPQFTQAILQQTAANTWTVS